MTVKNWLYKEVPLAANNNSGVVASNGGVAASSCGVAPESDDDISAFLRHQAGTSVVVQAGARGGPGGANGQYFNFYPGTKIIVVKCELSLKKKKYYCQSFVPLLGVNLSFSHEKK